MRIDFDNIDQRILALPFPARNYGGCSPARLTSCPGRGERRLTTAWETAARSSTSLTCVPARPKAARPHWKFLASANGEKALYEQLREPKPRDAATGNRPMAIGPSSNRCSGQATKPNKLDGSLKRCHGGGSRSACRRQQRTAKCGGSSVTSFTILTCTAPIQVADGRLSAVVDNVTSRSIQLHFADMLGEITAQHVYVFGGDRPRVKHVSGGSAGRGRRIENDRYRFAHVYDGENWIRSARSADEPGVDVKEGEYRWRSMVVRGTAETRFSAFSRRSRAKQFS